MNGPDPFQPMGELTEYELDELYYILDADLLLDEGIHVIYDDRNDVREFIWVNTNVLTKEEVKEEYGDDIYFLVYETMYQYDETMTDSDNEEMKEKLEEEAKTNQKIKREELDSSLSEIDSLSEQYSLSDTE